MSSCRMKSISVVLVVFVLLSFVHIDVFAKSSKPKLSKVKLTMNKGEKYKLKLRHSTGKIKWMSSKKSIATVSSKGVVKAQKRGTAVITAKNKSKKYKCKIKVETPRLNHSVLFLPLKCSYKLKLIGNSQKIKWQTTNKNIVVVNSGKVQGVKAGTASVYAKVGKSKYKCSIQVGKYTIKENYSILKEYILKYGYENTNGDYLINTSNFDDSGEYEYIYGVVYSIQSGKFEFLLTQTSVNNNYPYASVKYFVDPNDLSDYVDITCSYSLSDTKGFIASKKLNAKFYERNIKNNFSIKWISGLTSSYAQEGADIFLDLAVSHWNMLLLDCLNMDLSDFGFLSIYD